MDKLDSHIEADASPSPHGEGGLKCRPARGGTDYPVPPHTGRVD